jgi:hypothetical protein
MYFPIDYYRFRNYRNIGAVFISDNIVSISFSRKRCENESDLAFYRSFPIVFIPKSDPEEHINTTATQSARDTDMLATGRVVGLAITITITIQ